MKNIRAGILLMVLLVSGNGLLAQTIEQGRKFIYYERFKSARETFQKILATSPNNEEAAYWYGQSLIQPDDRSAKDLADAKAFYQKTLQANPNSALLMAGIGHVELLEGKTQDARSHFEAAVSLSQGKNIAVLNAIGLANGNFDIKNGDAAYAIEKLKQATQVKKFNDPDVYVNLGDAYRKMGDGGNAVLSYQAALALDSRYARANYRLGKLYQSQGIGQKSIYMQYYEEAISNDPAYAPVYSNLFNYYYESDVTKAAEYFEKWLANSDDDPKACFYRSSMKYAQGLFQEAISKADQCIAAEGANPYPNLYGIKAYALMKLKDSSAAKLMFDEYFRRQDTARIMATDMINYATLLMRDSAGVAQATGLIEKAAMQDTTEASTVKNYTEVAKLFERQKKYKEAADWYNKILYIKKNQTVTDLYNAGYNYFRSSVYDSAVKIFTLYTNKFPEQDFGFYMLGKTSAMIDSTGQQGLAVPYYEKAMQIAEAATDKTKVKDRLMGTYRFFIEYYYNVKKDQAAALSYIEKALALDPADEQLLANKEFISKNDPKAPPKKPAPPTTPKTQAKPKTGGTNR